MEKYKKKNNLKKLNFIQKAHTLHLNYLLTGSQKITESHIKFLQAMEYFLIMNLQEEEKHLLLEKLLLV